MKNRNKFILVILLNFYFVQFVHSQINAVIVTDSSQREFLNKPDCDTLILVTKENINDLNSIYQLSFLNKIPRTRLDSLVNKLVNLKHHGEIGEMIDHSEDIKHLIDSIGQLRSKEAYGFLYTICETYFGEYADKPIKRIAFRTRNSFITLNKYFLSNLVNSTKSDDFTWAVREQYNKKKPTIYYCIPENPNHKYIRLRSKINTKKQDKQIIEIINKYSDLRKSGGFENKAQDKILNEVSKLDFVTDAFVDKCETRLTIYPSFSNLGVVIQVDGVSIEKCYYMQVGDYSSKKNFLGWNVKNRGNLDKLIYLNNYIEKGFIKQQRDLCNPIPRQEDLWKVKYSKASKIVFKDTLHNFVLDSSFHNLGKITTKGYEIRKYFKYIGNEQVHLSNINDDPHFITQYNQTNLEKNRVYEFTVIFSLENIQGEFSSKMGFELSNGDKLMFNFIGNHIENK